MSVKVPLKGLNRVSDELMGKKWGVPPKKPKTSFREQNSSINSDKIHYFITAENFDRYMQAKQSGVMCDENDFGISACCIFKTKDGNYYAQDLLNKTRYDDINQILLIPCSVSQSGYYSTNPFIDTSWVVNVGNNKAKLPNVKYVDEVMTSVEDLSQQDALDLSLNSSRDTNKKLLCKYVSVINNAVSKSIPLEAKMM